MSLAVVIVAAGSGTRLGGDRPKQYVSLAGVPILHRSITAFLRHDGVTRLVTVIRPGDEALYAEALAGLDDPRILPSVEGGATRAYSVRNGLEALAPHAPDHVLIHDAARPFVPEAVIERVAVTLKDCEGACAGLPVIDALWSVTDGLAASPVPREGLWRAQTPQGFHFAPLLAAHRAHDGSGTDDVAVARGAGLKVRFVPGAERNYKITTQADLDRARRDVALPDGD